MLPSQIFLCGKPARSTTSIENLLVFQYFQTSFKVSVNDQMHKKLSLLDIFAFSSTFLGVKMKYYNLNFFYVETVHGVDHLQKT